MEIGYASFATKQARSIKQINRIILANQIYLEEQLPRQEQESRETSMSSQNIETTLSTYIPIAIELLLPQSRRYMGHLLSSPFEYPVRQQQYNDPRVAAATVYSRTICFPQYHIPSPFLHVPMSHSCRSPLAKKCFIAFMRTDLLG